MMKRLKDMRKKIIRRAAGRKGGVKKSVRKQVGDPTSHEVSLVTAADSRAIPGRAINSTGRMRRILTMKISLVVL